MTSFKEFVTIIYGKRKYLLCSDKKGLKLIQPILDQLIDLNLPFEFYFIGDCANQLKIEENEENLKIWLSKQRMGSFLYLVNSWNVLKRMKLFVEEIGFSDEEVQYIGYGKKEINVFCSRCHHITAVMENDVKSKKTCGNCHILLTISDHYSSLHDAYLGYIARL